MIYMRVLLISALLLQFPGERSCNKFSKFLSCILPGNLRRTGKNDAMEAVSKGESEKDSVLIASSSSDSSAGPEMLQSLCISNTEPYPNSYLPHTKWPDHLVLMSSASLINAYALKGSVEVFSWHFAHTVIPHEHLAAYVHDYSRLFNVYAGSSMWSGLGFRETEFKEIQHDFRKILLTSCNRMLSQVNTEHFNYGHDAALRGLIWGSKPVMKILTNTDDLEETKSSPGKRKRKTPNDTNENSIPSEEETFIKSVRKFLLIKPFLSYRSFKIKVAIFLTSLKMHGRDATSCSGFRTSVKAYMKQFDSVQLIDGLAKNARGNELRSHRDPINDRQTNIGTQQQSDGNNQQRLNQDGRNEEDQRRSNQRRSNQRRLNQRRLNRERKKERLKENVKDILKTGGLTLFRLKDQVYEIMEEIKQTYYLSCQATPFARVSHGQYDQFFRALFENVDVVMFVIDLEAARHIIDCIFKQVKFDLNKFKEDAVQFVERLVSILNRSNDNAAENLDLSHLRVVCTKSFCDTRYHGYPDIWINNLATTKLAMEMKKLVLNNLPPSLLSDDTILAENLPLLELFVQYPLHGLIVPTIRNKVFASNFRAIRQEVLNRRRNEDENVYRASEVGRSTLENDSNRVEHSQDNRQQAIEGSSQACSDANLTGHENSPDNSQTMVERQRSEDSQSDSDSNSIHAQQIPGHRQSNSGSDSDAINDPRRE